METFVELEKERLNGFLFDIEERIDYFFFCIEEEIMELENEVDKLKNRIKRLEKTGRCEYKWK